MKNLMRLLYVSKATDGFARSDITDVLETSRKNNKKLGITGLLCYKGGYFAQILEGDDLALLELYIKIARDNRHRDVVIVSMSTTARQMFKGWDMGMLSEDLVPFVEVGDLLKLRKTGLENSNAVVMMQHWLTLLESRSRPSGR